MIAGLWALIAPFAWGQDHGSHVRISDWGSGNNSANADEISRQLKQRLGRAGPQGLDPELIKRLRDELQKGNNASDAAKALKNDPELLQQLQRFSSQNPEWQQELGRQLADRRGDSIPPNIDEFIKKLQPQLTGKDGPPNRDSTGTDTTRRANTRTTSPDQDRNPFKNDSFTRDRERHSSSGSSDALESERLREFSNRLSRYLPDSMKNSDAMKRAASGLSKIDWGKTDKWKFLPDDFASKLKLGKSFDGAGDFLKRTFGRFEGKHVPDLPTVKAPNIKSPNFSSGSSLHGFVPPAPSTPGAGSTFGVVATIAAIIAAAFIAWKFLIQPAASRKAGKPAWDPGSWPISPDRIQTSADIIRAFDHFALQTAGKPARHWHHQAVADKIGADDSNRQTVAKRLASVYAQARYAPSSEPLTQEQIASARYDLCSLLGAVAP
jgi:hypothetical protein